MMRPTDFLARQDRLSWQVPSTSPICLGCLEDGWDGTTLPQPSLPDCSQSPPGAFGGAVEQSRQPWGWELAQKKEVSGAYGLHLQRETEGHQRP